MELYVQSDTPHGEELIDLIQGEYEVFDDDLYTSGKAASLLEDILESGWDDDSGESPVDAHELYCRRDSTWSHTSMRDAWLEFCGRVREDPCHEPDLPILFDEELARTEVELPREGVLYRGRVGFEIGEGGLITPWTDMGPPQTPKSGRANTEGEAVLYVADQEATVVAEVRPCRGLLVSIAEVRPTRNLWLVDLSKLPAPCNPFTAEAPQYEVELVDLLLAFGEELGRPLRRDDDALDYVPCQKLVRRIRSSGFYDGIRYPSAMAPGGTNIVIFDPKLATIGAKKLVEVQEVGISYEPFESE
jgi:hypothetical protein